MIHRTFTDFGDKLILFFTMRLRWFADTFFAKRYGHRAVVLETVAGVLRHDCRHVESFKKFKKNEIR